MKQDEFNKLVSALDADDQQLLAVAVSGFAECLAKDATKHALLITTNGDTGTYEVVALNSSPEQVTVILEAMGALAKEMSRPAQGDTLQ